jgi:hypothetical protein
LPENLKVLVWGTAEQGACAYYRGWAFDSLLLDLGIEQRHLTGLQPQRKPGWEGKEIAREQIAEAIEMDAQGRVQYDISPVEWADIVVFRRYYNTSYACAGQGFRAVPGAEELGCGFLTKNGDEALAHPHGAKYQDSLTNEMWPLFRDSWTGGIIYETDDLHISHGVQKWNGYWKAANLERPLIEDMARRADLLTVATPMLATHYGRYNPRIRVIRNAIDPDLYRCDTPRPDGTKPRLVYYGSTARMRDYAGQYVTGDPKDGKGYAFRAVQENRNLLTRVFYGTNPGTEEIIEKLFDEHHPYVVGIEAFAKALTNSHGDIGIAPLGGDEFDRCKSELHWLEYAITGQAFIGERYNGDGPYQVVRDGVDGLLARGAQEWYDSVKKLAKSKDLREQLAGAAKERVIADYSLKVRAQEWADAYRWVAENAGIGKKQAVAA